jgi:hypothetical protein
MLMVMEALANHCLWVDCRHLSPYKTSHSSPRRKAGFFIAAGNTPSSHPPAMTHDTQMTLALLQELLLALRANDAEGFKGWLALGLEELGRQVVLELMQDWMSPLLTEMEQDRLVGWHLGVSL